MFEPYLTEKSVSQNSKGIYIFKVMLKYNKKEIKSIIENAFSVKVKKINIINKQGKLKRFKGIEASRSNIKKAVITLEKNYKIPGFETDEKKTEAKKKKLTKQDGN